MVKIGKGDLVGCDISIHLLHGSQGNAGNQGSQDAIVKSSGDVKVSFEFKQISKVSHVKYSSLSVCYAGSYLLRFEKHTFEWTGGRVAVISRVSAGVCQRHSA